MLFGFQGRKAAGCHLLPPFLRDHPPHRYAHVCPRIKPTAAPVNCASVSWTRPEGELRLTGAFPPPHHQVSPFVNVSEKTPLKKVQRPNFADFSHFREEVSVK